MARRQVVGWMGVLGSNWICLWVLIVWYCALHLESEFWALPLYLAAFFSSRSIGATRRSSNAPKPPQQRTVRVQVSTEDCFSKTTNRLNTVTFYSKFQTQMETTSSLTERDI